MTDTQTQATDSVNTPHLRVVMKWAREIPQ